MLSLVTIIFIHIIADFHLQGILAKMKQKDWWKLTYKEIMEKDKKYDNDWIVCLFWHSFQWSFMIMLPLLVNCNFDIDYKYLCVFGANIIGHMVIDDLKCNRYKINLITDQFLHMIQIILSWIIL